MVLPNFKFFLPIITFPSFFGVFSFFFFFILALTYYTLRIFAFGIFQRAYDNYFNYSRTLNMESLITVGSLSSLIMAVYIFAKYFIYGTKNDTLDTIL